MKNEYGIESLLFLRDVKTWKDRYFDIAATARVSRAKRLIALYIEPDGLLTVNIPDRMTMSIKKKAAAGEFNIDIFDDAEAEIHHLLVIGACARYIRTNAYKQLEDEQQAGRSKSKRKSIVSHE